MCRISDRTLESKVKVKYINQYEVFNTSADLCHVPSLQVINKLQDDNIYVFKVF